MEWMGYTNFALHTRKLGRYGFGISIFPEGGDDVTLVLLDISKIGRELCFGGLRYFVDELG